jgi:rhodanese-related sulfurtransferase
MKKAFSLVAAIVVCAIVFWGLAPAIGSDAPRITKEDLQKDMNDGTAIVIDVRTGRDWNNTEKKIKGAVRQEPGAVKDWAGQYAKDQKIVLYCD